MHWVIVCVWVGGGVVLRIEPTSLYMLHTCFSLRYTLSLEQLLNRVVTPSPVTAVSRELSDPVFRPGNQPSHGILLGRQFCSMIPSCLLGFCGH